LDVPPFANSGTADSFFDVFYQNQVGDRVFHPAMPVPIVSVITHKPPGPGDTYVNPFTEPVDLLDASGNPTGIKILREVHTPNPVEVDHFPESRGEIELQIGNGASGLIGILGPPTVKEFVGGW